MSTTILSFQNRVVIETLHNEGRSLRYIANYLGFSKTTIFNELHRLNSEYQAGLAQTDFERKVSQRGRDSDLCHGRDDGDLPSRVRHPVLGQGSLQLPN